MGPGPAKDLYWPIKIKAFLNIRPLDFFVIVPLKLICNDVISNRSPTKPNPRWVFKTSSLSENDIYYTILTWLGVGRSQQKTSSVRDPTRKQGSADGNWRETSQNHWTWTLSLAKAVHRYEHSGLSMYYTAERRGKYLKYYWKTYIPCT